MLLSDNDSDFDVEGLANVMSVTLASKSHVLKKLPNTETSHDMVLNKRCVNMLLVENISSNMHRVISNESRLR